MTTHALNRQVFGRPEDYGRLMSISEADALLMDWVPNERLRLHMRQVAHLLKCWALEVENLDEAAQLKWELAGLLHDADWDRWPEEHCRRIVEELERRNMDPELIYAIAAHGPRYFGVDPVNRLDKMLYAFDELSGFVHAYSLMRPEGYRGMEVKGVVKRLKDKTFAASVSREDIRDASERAGIPQEELIRFVIRHQADS